MIGFLSAELAISVTGLGAYMRGANLRNEHLFLMCCLVFYFELIKSDGNVHSHTGTNRDIHIGPEIFLKWHASLGIPVIIKLIHGSSGLQAEDRKSKCFPIA